MKTLTFLAVDDHVASVELIQTFVQEFMLSTKVLTATSVRQAWERPVQIQPDLLISDLAMPQEDGSVLINRVRKHANPKISQMPAIAITAYADAYIINLALEQGFARVMVKPFDLDSLLETISLLTAGCLLPSHHFLP